MINSLKHAMLTDTGRVQFDEPLSKPAPSSYNRGWNIDGTYWTTTDPRGNHMLNLDGSLESPETLGPEFAHYVGFKIASDSKISSEIFWTGYEPPSRSTLGSKASFFQHYPLDYNYDFMKVRALNKQRKKTEEQKFNAKPCEIVSLK